jgi:hypothetical protein
MGINYAKPADDPVAVDRAYQRLAYRIHRPLHDPEGEEHRVDRGNLVLEWTGPADLPMSWKDYVDPFFSDFGMRVLYLLYRVANDKPNYRKGHFTVHATTLLDMLGLKRDARGIHYSRNRERLWRTLRSAHYLRVTRSSSPEAMSLLTLAKPEGNHLPKTIEIRLNFYRGVRQNAYQLGNDFVLVPPAFILAHVARSARFLGSYFLSLPRKWRFSDTTLRARAALTLRNTTLANALIQRALDELVEAGLLHGYRREGRKIWQVRLTPVLPPGRRPVGSPRGTTMELAI